MARKSLSGSELVKVYRSRRVVDRVSLSVSTGEVVGLLTQTDLLAATSEASGCCGSVFNVASGEQISILELYCLIRAPLLLRRPDIEPGDARHCDFRAGEIRHSLGDISRIADCLGYHPATTAREALALTLDWYLENGAIRAAG